MENHLLAQLCNIPLVSSAVSQVGTIYAQNKQRNSITKAAFNMAEIGLRNVFHTAQPLLQHLQEPMNKLSNLACEHLNHLQTDYPFISTPTEEIWNSARLKVNELLSLPFVDSFFKGREEKQENKAEDALDELRSDEVALQFNLSKSVTPVNDVTIQLLKLINVTYIFLLPGFFGHHTASSLILPAKWKPRKPVNVCCLCGFSWSISDESGERTFCLLCILRNHLQPFLASPVSIYKRILRLRVLPHKVLVQIYRTAGCSFELVFRVLRWLVDHTLVPEFHIGRCNFESEDSELFAAGGNGDDDDNGDNTVHYGYVPIHPLDLANVVYHISQSKRIYWKRVY